MSFKRGPGAMTGINGTAGCPVFFRVSCNVSGKKLRDSRVAFVPLELARFHAEKLFDGLYVRRSLVARQAFQKHLAVLLS